ncbi:MAG: endonuclease MutS2 [Ruminococcaceae bacterium]|nr:endonuclease MutS2 [Oscillospiraceae bacterium]
MKISEKTLKTLEFDKIRELLAECALTEGARGLCRALLPTDREEEIILRQSHTQDAAKLIGIKGTPSFGEIIDISDACERAVKGATLTPRELLDVADNLRVCRRLLEYIRTNRLFDTSLDEIFERLIPNKSLEDKITRAIISEEMIADEASVALADIRRKIRVINIKIRDMLQRYTQNNEYSKYLQENIVTMRNGRYVIPVKVECRNEIRGLVHDTSSSGATLFVEPVAVVEANNELRELESKEAHEIERILSEMSADVAECSSVLLLNYRNITELAFIFACGELAFRMNATAPSINRERRVELRRARHPLIDKKKVVPVDIAIGGEYDTVIVTGPNTGGKTVTLKTLGLLSLMAQAGLQIPAEDGSSVCIFDRMLADIGDEQSIEHSLSTFSSHMVNIVSILDDLTDKTLVLFDELGAGTDPIEGAALAVAIIEQVREAGVICAATTHYAELKAYALNTAGVRNASCEFDIDTLKPTYKLIIGTPGKSNAFAISEKLGLPENIVTRAKGIVSSEDRDFEDVIAKLEASRVEMEKHRAEAAEIRAELEREKAEADKKYAAKIAEAEKTLEDAQKKSTELLNTARASSEFVFDQLDKLKKAKDSERLADELDEKRRNIRKHLRENEDKIDPVQRNEDENYVLPRALRKGDNVLIRNINKRAVVTSLPDKRGNLMVRAGLIDMRTSEKNLKLLNDDEINVITKDKKKVTTSDFSASRVRQIKSEIDLRGKNGDEAWLLVDKYFDDAIVAGLHSVHLIHGKGTGALKNALWKLLRTDGRVKSFRIGQYGEGDGGVTVVEFK